MLNIKIQRINAETKLPTKATSGSNAYDLYSPIDTQVYSGDVTKIGLGFKLAIPAGFVGLVCTRSGKAYSNKINVINAPGVVDSDYRGEIGVLLFNESTEYGKYEVKKHDKIAQILFVKSEDVEFDEITSLDNTDRGAGGFGSTGV